MLVKFCGMTNYKDAKESLDLGVDFIGFVFYKKSPRFIEVQEVKNILKKLPKETKSVGVFVEESQMDIEYIMNYCALTYAQVYNDFDMQNIIRAYRIQNSLPKTIHNGLILVDRFSAKVGGSGEKFDWSILESFEAINRTFVAGGISFENIEEVVKYKPYGVDLVSSIERYPGKKDKAKMKAFIEKLRSIGWN